MALWDKIFSNKKKDEDPRHLNPIVQKSPAPAAPVRVSAAKPVPKPVAPPPPPPPPPPKPESASRIPPRQEVPMQNAERETKSRKKKVESNTKMRTRPSDDAGYVKRGLSRQSEGDHDGAIEDFTKAIELNPNLAQAYASRGVSKEAKGDGAGAKSDYSKSIQIEIMSEINRQMRENPDVEM
jgi:tetratricopeptide (TPR) repeat protein